MDPASRCADAYVKGPSAVAVDEKETLYVLPSVIFNDDRLTLDGMTLEEMGKEAGRSLHMVSCSPLQYFPEITDLINATE